MSLNLKMMINTLLVKNIESMKKTYLSYHKSPEYSPMSLAVVVVQQEIVTK